VLPATSCPSFKQFELLLKLILDFNQRFFQLVAAASHSNAWKHRDTFGLPKNFAGQLADLQ